MLTDVAENTVVEEDEKEEDVGMWRHHPVMHR